MSTEGNFRELARHVRHLLECDMVSLLSGCPIAELRHPILEAFAPGPWSYIGCYGAAEALALLDSEWVRALCDAAVQSARVQYCGRAYLPLSGRVFRSIAAAPLERPAGVLGLVLLCDMRTDAFGAGERSLLEHTLPWLASELERSLRRDFRTILQTRLWQAPVETAQQAPASSEPVAIARTPLSSSEPSSEGEQGLLNNEFISMVSHELRTPLTAIKGYVGLLQAYSIGASSGGESGPAVLGAGLQRRYLDVIMQQAGHLEVLAGDLLDLSSLQAGRLSLRCTQFDIAPLCEQIAQLFQERIEHESPGKYYIRCLFEQDLPPVYADPDRVQQILTNLLENAVKYTPDGGLIEVQVRARPAEQSTAEAGSAEEAGQQESAAPGPLMAHVMISDQGIGISPGQQARLFQPFSHLEHSARGYAPGVGLGLYIARRLVEAQGGTITLCSREGKGTRVIFTLPLAGGQQSEKVQS